MKPTLLTVCLCLQFFNLTAQDPHLQKPKSVEELLEKNNLHGYRTLNNKQNYLVVENLRNIDRHKIFIGDIIGIKDKEGNFYQDEIVEISDSTFTISTYNSSSQHIEYYTFYPDDISRFYKKRVRKGIRWGLSMASFAPLAYDWIYFKLKPWENLDNVIKIAGLQLAILIITNRDKFFKSRKISEHYRIRIFKSY